MPKTWGHPVHCCCAASAPGNAAEWGWRQQRHGEFYVVGRRGSTACALIAGKAHYFGVGGSARGFEAAARAEGLEHEVVWRKADGASNVREIIRLRRRRDGGRGGSSNGGGDGGDGSTERGQA